MLVLSLCASVAFASPPPTNPSAFLDKPLSNTSHADAVKFEVLSNSNHNFFTGLTVSTMLNSLQSVINGNTNVFGGYTGSGHQARVSNSSQRSQLQSLVNDLRSFPGATELLSMTVNSGSSAFVDEYGIQYTSPPAAYYQSLEVADSNKHEITFTAGRSTAIGSVAKSSQLRITSGQHEYSIFAYGYTTPIVIDMDNDGRLQASNGKWLPHALTSNAQLVAFDITGNGTKELIEWVGAKDGLLVTGYEAGKEINGLNLFGDAGGFANGYAKLATLDTNNDNVLTGTELNGLMVWQDKNSNASVDKGEMRSLASLGITSINTNHNNMVSSCVINGETVKMWDWHPFTMKVAKVK